MIQIYNKFKQLHLLATIFLLSLLVANCAHSSDSKEKILLAGHPPRPDEDPFAITEIFPPDEAAAPSGTLTPFDDHTTLPNGTSDFIPPSNNVEVSTPVHTFKCFSCVKVCRHRQNESNCSLGEEKICGWGTSTDKKSASVMAKTQCEQSVLKLNSHIGSSQLDNCSEVFCE